MSRPARRGHASRPTVIATLASALIAGMPAAVLAQATSADQTLPAVTVSGGKTLPGNPNESVTTGTKTEIGRAHV